MSLRDTVVLELRVALSRTAQPVWVRILKWTVIVSAVVYFWRASTFLVVGRGRGSSGCEPTPAVAHEDETVDAAVVWLERSRCDSARRQKR